jgi:glycosyltransferase involved in cell wall biosynthesis
MGNRNGERVVSAKKILFITPGAQSFGGNIFLLNFLRWFKSHSDIPFVTLYGRGGDLEKDFSELCRTFQFYFDDDSPALLKKGLAKFANQAELRKHRLKRQIARENIGLVYSNAVTNHRLLAALAGLDVPLISHCHELQSLIHETGGGFEYTKRRTSHFIAVSNAVRQNLIVDHGVEPDAVSLVYGFIPTEDRSAETVRAMRGRVRSELGIPEGSFIVGGSGTLNWRKAPEVFVQIAREAARKNPSADLYFLWVGGAAEGDVELYRVRHDIAKMKLENRVRFIEHKPNPMDYYAAFDAFAMVSREDPFPLVCLESASLGKPIVCFENAGGTPEFVADDCGLVVPYMDIGAFADRLLELYSCGEKRGAMGEAAAVKVRRHHDISIGAPKVLDIVERYYRAS